MAKKITVAVIIFCLMGFVTISAIASTPDLSGLSYDELVSLKEQINLAIWNSAEWEEVEVPQGVYQIGVDIPAGHWTIKCADEWRYTKISWGENLSDSGEKIEWKGRYSMDNWIYNPNHKSYKKGAGITEYPCEVKDGEYMVIDGGSAVFMPYHAKQSFSFKAFSSDSSQKKTPTVTSEPSKDNINEIVDSILACKNNETERAWKLIQDNAAYMDKNQLQECLISYGKWKSYEYAETEIKSLLKSPRSFYLYDGSIGTPAKQEDGSYETKVTVKYGATNSFGGEMTDEVTVYVHFEADIDAVEVTFTKAELSAYDKWRLR